ncbi:hypothetical protein R1flu_021466 [Riccia fluitans]|uniref:Uncharacterized protein n=1 Tax=Riccia fluitans TaxID=41844 RepID=A0ABD1ZPG1_9MARC
MHARCNTDIATIPGHSAAFRTFEFHQIGNFRAKKRLVDQGCSSVLEKLKLQIRELDARQQGKAVLLATQEETSRASREPIDEEEAMAQAWWEGVGEPDEPIGTEQDRIEGNNSSCVV